MMSHLRNLTKWKSNAQSLMQAAICVPDVHSQHVPDWAHILMLSMHVSDMVRLMVEDQQVAMSKVPTAAHQRFVWMGVIPCVLAPCQKYVRSATLASDWGW
eukprot:scaffold115824_cov21-Tisochrysis_lutea.AAC.1